MLTARTFEIGHNGDIERVYTLQKGLSNAEVEKMSFVLDALVRVSRG